MPGTIDHLIIGSGILGLSAAYNMAKCGLRCTVVDKAEFSTGASGVNLGQISLVDREAGISLGMALGSLDLYKSLAAEWGTSFEYHETGGTYLIYDEENMESARELTEIQRKNGLDISILMQDRVNEVEPYLNSQAVLGAIHCKREGTLNPLKTCVNYRDAARSLGVEFIDHCQIDGFGFKDGSIQSVSMGGEDITVDQVILATGAWTKEAAGKLNLDYPIHYARGTAMVSLPVPRTINGPVVPGIFLKMKEDIQSWTYLGLAQHENGSIVIGQATSLVENYDCSLEYGGLKKMAQLLGEHFPILRDLSITRMWAGVTPHTQDGNPLFGQSGKVRNLFLLAGFKGAFTTAPKVGEYVAEFFSKGSTSINMEPYSPRRFET